MSGGGPSSTERFRRGQAGFWCECAPTHGSTEEGSKNELSGYNLQAFECLVFPPSLWWTLHNGFLPFYPSTAALVCPPHLGLLRPNSNWG